MKRTTKNNNNNKKKKQKKNVEVNEHSGEIWRNAVDVNKASYRTLTWRFL